MADETPKTVTGKDGEKPSFDSPPQEDAAATGNVGTGHGDLNPVTATDNQLEQAKVYKSDAERIAELPPRPVYNPNAGLRPRVGGPYLDNLELEESERRRAIVEGRKPDYKNMAGTAGVPLMTAGQVANLHGGDPALADFIDDNKDNPKLGPTPVGEVAFHGTNIDVVETSLDETKQRREWDNSVVTSHDNPDVVYAEPVADVSTAGAKKK